MFHTENGLFFERYSDGTVRIVKTFDGKDPAENRGNILFEQIIEGNVWVSVVLSMSSFGERGGDWQKYRKHHFGEMDILQHVD